MNNKLIKLVSKMMMIIILATSVLSLTACEIDFPRRNRVFIRPDEYSFKTFVELQQFIQPQHVECNSSVVVFDLDNEPSVISTNYIVDGTSKKINGKYTYYLKEIIQEIEVINAEDNNSLYMVCYFFDVYVNTDDDFEIKFNEVTVNDDYSDPSKQKISAGFTLFYKGQIVGLIGCAYLPLMEDGDYGEYCSNIIDTLLKNLVVIK